MPQMSCILFLECETLLYDNTLEPVLQSVKFYRYLQMWFPNLLKVLTAPVSYTTGFMSQTESNPDVFIYKRRSETYLDKSTHFSRVRWKF